MRQPRRRSQAAQVSIDAPINGIIESLPPGGKRGRDAEVLENWLPTLRGLAVRGGTQEHADISSEVLTMATYASSGSQQMFATTASEIYEVTSSATAASAQVTGLTSGYWSFVQIGTSGGDFLIGVNGSDSARQFDGTSWSTVSGITGVTTSSLNYVWTHINRLFFIEEQTLKVWYLPSGSIGGAASDLNLAGVFQRGGDLLFGGTWSLDSGDGMDDKCVFVTTQGEVAIYSGSDPSDAATWALEGLFEIGKPLSPRGHIRVGGDLLIATDDGIIPLSSVFTKDASDLSLAAVSRPIQTTWKLEADRASDYLQLIKWTGGETMLAILPGVDRVLSANLKTGAWAVQTGWSGNCAAELSNGVYVGTTTGVVKQIDITGADMGAPFTAKVLGAFQDFGDPIRIKAASMMRGRYLADSEFDADYSVSVDFTPDFPASPAAVPNSPDVLVWGSGNWGEKVWSKAPGDATTGVLDSWVSVAGVGQEVAPGVQITSGGSTKMSVELVGIDMIVDGGGRVV